MGLDFVAGASLKQRPPGSATKHMWLERKVLGLGQRPAFSFSFLIPQQEKHMFFPYRREIVPRVSKSLGHGAGTAHRALGRKLGSTGSTPGSRTRLSWLVPSKKMGWRRGAGL